MLCDYEGALGMNLTFEAAIEPDRAVERHHAVEGDVSAEEGEVLTVGLAFLFLALVLPHEPSPLLWAPQETGCPLTSWSLFQLWNKLLVIQNSTESALPNRQKK